jgi:protein O-GlcNAc transferase
MKLDNAKAAVDAYEKAIVLAEKQELKRKYLNRYAVALYLRGKREDAIRELEKRLKSDSALLANQYLIHFILGTLYQEQGETAKAIPLLETAARLNPESADAHYNLGLAYELSGRRNEAKVHYSQALRLNPGANDTALALERIKG